MSRIAHGRAESNGRDKPNTDDVRESIKWAVLIGGLDRAGIGALFAKGMGKNVAGRVAGKAAAEGGTESLQELFEYTGERLGTPRKMVAREIADVMVLGAIGGTTIAGGIATFQEATASIISKPVDQAKREARTAGAPKPGFLKEMIAPKRGDGEAPDQHPLFRRKDELGKKATDIAKDPSGMAAHLFADPADPDPSPDLDSGDGGATADLEGPEPFNMLAPKRETSLDVPGAPEGLDGDLNTDLDPDVGDAPNVPGLPGQQPLAASEPAGLDPMLIAPKAPTIPGTDLSQKFIAPKAPTIPGTNLPERMIAPSGEVSGQLPNVPGQVPGQGGVEASPEAAVDPMMVAPKRDGINPRFIAPRAVDTGGPNVAVPETGLIPGTDLPDTMIAPKPIVEMIMDEQVKLGKRASLDPAAVQSGDKVSVVVQGNYFDGTVAKDGDRAVVLNDAGDVVAPLDSNVKLFTRTAPTKADAETAANTDALTVFQEDVQDVGAALEADPTDPASLEDLKGLIKDKRFASLPREERSRLRGLQTKAAKATKEAEAQEKAAEEAAKKKAKDEEKAAVEKAKADEAKAKEKADAEKAAAEKAKAEEDAAKEQAKAVKGNEAAESDEASTKKGTEDADKESTGEGEGKATEGETQGQYQKGSEADQKGGEGEGVESAKKSGDGAAKEQRDGDAKYGEKPGVGSGRTEGSKDNEEVQVAETERDKVANEGLQEEVAEADLKEWTDRLNNVETALEAEEVNVSELLTEARAIQNGLFDTKYGEGKSRSANLIFRKINKRADELWSKVNSVWGEHGDVWKKPPSGKAKAKEKAEAEAQKKESDKMDRTSKAYQAKEDKAKRRLDKARKQVQEDQYTALLEEEMRQKAEAAPKVAPLSTDVRPANKTNTGKASRAKSKASKGINIYGKIAKGIDGLDKIKESINDLILTKMNEAITLHQKKNATNGDYRAAERAYEEVAAMTDAFSRTMNFFAANYSHDYAQAADRMESMLRGVVDAAKLDPLFAGDFAAGHFSPEGGQARHSSAAMTYSEAQVKHSVHGRPGRSRGINAILYDRDFSVKAAEAAKKVPAEEKARRLAEAEEAATMSEAEGLAAIGAIVDGESDAASTKALRDLMGQVPKFGVSYRAAEKAMLEIEAERLLGSLETEFKRIKRLPITAGKLRQLKSLAGRTENTSFGLRLYEEIDFTITALAEKQADPESGAEVVPEPETEAETETGVIGMITSDPEADATHSVEDVMTDGKTPLETPMSDTFANMDSKVATSKKYEQKDWAERLEYIENLKKNALPRKWGRRVIDERAVHWLERSNSDFEGILHLHDILSKNASTESFVDQWGMPMERYQVEDIARKLGDKLDIAMKSKSERNAVAETAIRKTQNKGETGIGFKSLKDGIMLKLAYSEHLVAMGLETPETAQRLAAAHLLVKRWLEKKRPEKNVLPTLRVNRIVTHEDKGATSTMQFPADENWYRKQVELFNYFAEEGAENKAYMEAAEQLLVEIARKSAFDLTLIQGNNKLFKKHFSPDVISAITYAAKDDPSGPVMRIEAYRKVLNKYFNGAMSDDLMLVETELVMTVPEYNSRFLKTRVDAFEDIDSSFEGSGFARVVETGKQYAAMEAKPVKVQGKKPDESVDAPLAATRKRGAIPIDVIPQSSWINAAMTYAQMEIQGC